MSGVLADRYASKEMREIWSQHKKVLLERELWIEVMKIQSKAGFDIGSEVIKSYERVKSNINLASINQRERILKHDVKARIDEFNSLVGHQSIHLGMTSRDLTENVELWQTKQSLELIEFKSLAFLHRLGEVINSYLDLAIVARTHNVPAQVTTLGRRFASWAEELIIAIQHLQQLRSRLPLRGIKGAVGTQQDARDLIGSDISMLDDEIAKTLGFQHMAISSTQIYPRSFDYEVLSSLVQISAAATNMSTNIRLMSGLGLISEGFKKEQVGSSAMPHKVNARSSERVNGLSVVLKGYSTMIAEISGNQWNEGDVSCSVVRRVALPNSFYAIDAILDTAINIVSNLTVSKSAIKTELKEHLPFLLSSKILIKAVDSGQGREEAHKIIKEYALIAANQFRETGKNSFFDLVSQDTRLGISKEFLEKLLADPLEHTGNAQDQAKAILGKIRTLCGSSKEITSYVPLEPI
jgi:adenylosuccinate lyase